VQVFFVKKGYEYAGNFIKSSEVSLFVRARTYLLHPFRHAVIYLLVENCAFLCPTCIKTWFSSDSITMLVLLGCYKNCDNSFSCFDTILACDRTTYGQACYL